MLAYSICSHRYKRGEQQFVDIESGWVGQVEDEGETQTVRTLVQVLLICSDAEEGSEEG